MRGIRSAVVTALGLWCASAVGDVTIRGHVVSAAGEPVPGAFVCWIRPALFNTEEGSIEGQSDKNGDFHLTLKADTNPRDLRNESVLVYAEGHGLAQSSVGSILVTTPGARLATVTLPPETETAFRITDSQDRCMAGHLVEAVSYTFGSGTRLPPSFVQATGQIADGTGLARFPAFPAERLRAIRVMSETYGCQQLDLTSAQVAGERRIALRDPGRVDIAFEPAGFPADRKWKLEILSSARGELGLLDPQAIGAGVLQGCYSSPLKTSEPFSIAALAEGELSFQVYGCADDESALPRWPAEKTRLTAGAHLKFTVPIEKTVPVQGRILEAGMPCAKAALRLFCQPAGCWIATETNTEGRFRANVLPGAITVAVKVRRQGLFSSSSRSMSVRQAVGIRGGELPDIVLD